MLEAIENMPARNWSQTRSISGLFNNIALDITCIFMVQNSSELGGLHMQPITKLDTIGVEYIGAKFAKGRVVFL